MDNKIVCKHEQPDGLAPDVDDGVVIGFFCRHGRKVAKLEINNFEAFKSLFTEDEWHRFFEADAVEAIPVGDAIGYDNLLRDNDRQGDI